jgi:CheY-like chemotaxis protein
MALGRHDPGVLDFVRREATATVPKPVKPARLRNALARAAANEGPSSRINLTTSGEVHVAPAVPLRVLVVEDNLVNQRVQRRLLEELGHRVDVVSDGVDAIEAVRHRGYDAIFLDLQMPGLDGLATARRLVAEWPRPQRARLIALTANAGREDREACIAAGMDDYLSKPVRLSDLETAMRSVGPNARDASTAATPIETDLIDARVLARLRELENASREPFLVHLVEEFFGDAPRRLALLEEALHRGDAPGVELQAHSLKGSAGALGIVHVGAIAAGIEARAKEGDLGALRGTTSRLREAIARAEPAMRGMVAS